VASVVIHKRELYRSASGDRWFLARETDPGRVFVQHQSALPGGSITNLDIEAFLRLRRHSPEAAELLRLIGTLV